MSNVKQLIAFASGVLTVLAFAPFDYYFLAYLSVSILFYLWLNETPRQAAKIGYFFGLGLLAVGTFWLHVSIDKFGGVPYPLAVLLALIFAALMSLFYALAGWLSSSLTLRYKASLLVHLLLIFPAVWTQLEVARAYFLSGFPWLSLGYSQIDTPVAMLAPVAGVFGISWFMALICGALVLLAKGHLKQRMASLTVLVAASFAVFLSVSFEWSESKGKKLTVSIIQGNVPQEIKWQPAYFESSIDLYQTLSFEQPADIVIWPETAIPGFYQNVEGRVINPLKKRLAASNMQLVTGIPYRADDYGYFNSMVSLGAVEDRYDKRHLVPFGEYAPLDFILRPLVDYFQIPMSDFRPGQSDKPLLKIGEHQAGVSICYEDAFGNETAQALPEADYLVNISNDAWFGDSLAPHQHMQIARMRAVETSRYLLRATNTGISAIIDHQGKVLSISPQDKVAVVRGMVEPRQGLTLYAQLKDGLILLLGLLVVTGLEMTRKIKSMQINSGQGNG